MTPSTGTEEKAPGIWPPFEAFYIQSMLFNTSSAMRSIDRLRRMLSKLPNPTTEQDLQLLPTRALLDELQNMVLQAGAISRYIWPSPQKTKPRYQARGRALCAALGLQQETSALGARDLRNAMEHFDERLDDYLAEGITGMIFPEYVGPKPLEDGVPGHFFRAYFTDVETFCLLGKEHGVKALADELIAIHLHLGELDQMGGRLRPPLRSGERPD